MQHGQKTQIKVLRIKFQYIRLEKWQIRLMKEINEVEDTTIETF